MFGIRMRCVCLMQTFVLVCIAVWLTQDTCSMLSCNFSIHHIVYYLFHIPSVTWWHAHTFSSLTILRSLLKIRPRWVHFIVVSCMHRDSNERYIIQSVLYSYVHSFIHLLLWTSATEIRKCLLHASLIESRYTPCHTKLIHPSRHHCVQFIIEYSNSSYYMCIYPWTRLHRYHFSLNSFKSIQ
jgi:hypothetical protein